MNSLKSFVLVLGACVGLPTYIMAVRPYARERERQQVPYQSDPDPANPAAPPKDPAALKGLYYPQSFAGDNKRGELVYVKEGCAQCHTQIIRPDYAGNDQIKVHSGREQIYKDGYKPVETRQTFPWDYMHEDFAMFGQRRVGPDLANAGYRYPAVDKDNKPVENRFAALYQYLYAPRSRQDREWSNSPGFKHLFDVKEKETPDGRADALQLPENLMPKEGWEIVPTEDARALAEYISGLKRDYDLPSSITGVIPKAEQ